MDRTRRRTDLLCGLGLAAVFLVSRLYDLAAFPLFLDEAKHVTWAERLRPVHAVGFGKPLPIALMAFCVRWASDPVWACRFLSTVLGGLAMWAAYRIGRRLESPATGLVAAALYLVCPFTVFYDRLALPDVYLSAFANLVLLATLRMVEAPDDSRDFGLAAFLGLSVLSKIPGLMTFATPVMGVLLLKPRSPAIWKRTGAVLLTAGVLVAFPVSYFFTHAVEVQQHTVLGGRGVVATRLLTNTLTAARVLWSYWTPPVALLAGLAVIHALWRRDRRTLLVAATGFVAVAFIVLTASFWFPRYLLPATVPALVLAAMAITGLIEKAWRLGRAARVAAPLLAAAALVLATHQSWLILTRPVKAPLPGTERFQYIQGWPSGYGTDQAAAYLRHELATHPEGIAVAGSLDADETPLIVLTAYFVREPRVRFEKLRVTDAAQLRGWLDDHASAYLALGERGPQAPPLPAFVSQRTRSSRRFLRPGGELALTVMEIGPGPAAPAGPTGG